MVFRPSWCCGSAGLLNSPKCRTLTEVAEGVGMESRPTTSARRRVGVVVLRGLRVGTEKKARQIRRDQTPHRLCKMILMSKNAKRLYNEIKAKQCAVKLRHLCEGAVEELISVVLVSGSHSLRLTCSGLDVHRLFYDDMEAEAARRKAVRALAKAELIEKLRKRKHGHG